MSFLELEPAARHLRQVAKAHAAGEIARQDYRRVRRKIIEDLHVDFSELRSDKPNLVDRFSLGDDDTRRRNAGDSTDAVPIVQSQSLATGRSVWPKVLIGLTLMLLMVVGFSSFASAAATIPSVDERDPNPKNSPTFSLRTLKILNFEELPGVSRLEVDDLLQTLMEQARSEAGVDTHSSELSLAELSEFGDLLVRLGVRKDQGLDASAVDALNALALRQRARRGVSIAQLERVAERLEEFYRKKGYLAARAFVPAQVVANEFAVLKVLPGRLARLEMDTDSPLAALARQAFEPHIEQAVQRSTLEELFYKLNTLPGVRASGNLSAGDAVGDTVLNVALDNRKEFASTFKLDNWGDERSSRYRLKARAEWYNPFGRADQLILEGALKVRPEEATDLALFYSLPGFRLGDAVSAAISKSDFEVSPRSSEDSIQGDAETLNLGFNRLLSGSRRRSIELGARAVVQQLDFNDTRQKLWWFAPTLEMHRVFDESRWVVRGGASVAAGRISSGRYSDQSAEFISGQAWLSGWKPIGAQAMRLEIATQVGSRDLPDSQKFRLGGVRRISSIRPGSFVADSAVVAGFEVSATPSALRDFGALEFFTRLGHGQVQTSGDRESAFAWDGGILWRLPEKRQLSGAIRLSVPFVTNGMEDSHDRARLLFDLAWRP